MEFTLDDEQKALVGAVCDLASGLAPKDTGDGAPAGPQPFDADAWAKLVEMGLTGLPFAEEAGGFGASAIEVMLSATELGAARVALPYADVMAAAAALDASGSPLLADVVAGEKIVLTAFGERGATWEPASPSRTATGSGDAARVSGAALGNVDLGAADAVITTALDGDDLGVYLVASPDVDGPAVTFDDAQAVRLGGREVLDAALALGNVAQCGEALGAMGAALKLTTEYLKTRKQFGVPLMRFQALTQRAADMYVSVELTRSAVQYAAMVVADPGDVDVNAAVSRTKYLVGTHGRHVGQEAIQLHGGIGMTAEYAVGHYTSRLATIERTFGDTRYHLGVLAADIATHQSVDVV